MRKQQAWRRQALRLLYLAQDETAAATTAKLDEAQAADDIFHSYEVRLLSASLLRPSQKAKRSSCEHARNNKYNSNLID